MQLFRLGPVLDAGLAQLLQEVLVSADQGAGETGGCLSAAPFSPAMPAHGPNPAPPVSLWLQPTCPHLGLTRSLTVSSPQAPLSTKGPNNTLQVNAGTLSPPVHTVCRAHRNLCGQPNDRLILDKAPRLKHI